MDKKETIVVKLGGSTLGSHDTILEDLVTLQKGEVSAVVVHGGGRVVSDWLEQFGIAPRFVNGLRVTDSQTLKVVTAVLAGLVNKELVAAILHLGGKAIGLCCADGGIIKAEIKSTDLGYVGEVAEVNPELLDILLSKGYMPVISPVSLFFSNGNNDMLLANVNGDTITGALAEAVNADRLIFMTDVAGIYNGEGKVVSRLTAAEAEDLKSSGAVGEGMIPKLDSCLKALSWVDTIKVVDGRVAHALLKEIEGDGEGTTIVR